MKSVQLCYSWLKLQRFYGTSSKDQLSIQRKICDAIGQKLNVKNWTDWYSVKTHHFKRLGGAQILNNYDHSLALALTEIFPEHDWNISNFNHPKTYSESFVLDSKSRETVRIFFNSVAKTLKITSYNDWYNVNSKNLSSLDENSKIMSLLKKFEWKSSTEVNLYFNALMEVYPDHPWKIFLFQNKDYFLDETNILNFLEEFKKFANILSLDDFYSVENSKIEDFGGAELLRINDDSLAYPLMRVYPSHNWNLWRFQTLPLNIFRSVRHQKSFLDFLGVNRKFSKFEDWYQISSQDFIELGGEELLKFYGSPWKAVMTIYKQKYKWQIWKFQSFTIEQAKRRKTKHQAFLDDLYEYLNLKSPEDWYQVDLREHDGKEILDYYNGDVARAFNDIYPEIGFKAWLFRPNSTSALYWPKLENQRFYLDDLAKTLKFLQFEDWYNVKNTDFADAAPLIKLYEDSPIKLLLAVYPEYQWKIFNFKNILKKSHYDDIQLQREFFKDLELKYRISSLEDWYNITSADVSRTSFGDHVMRRYKYCIRTALSSIYPQHTFKLWKFNHPIGFWNDLGKQRELFDEIGIELGITNWNGWYNIEARDIIDYGGGAVLNTYYNSSHIRALSSIYPEHDWKIWKFVKVPSNFWDDEKNVELVLEWLTKELKIKHLDDWYRVTGSQLQYLGVSSLIAKHGGIIGFLKKQYPLHSWDEKSRIADKENLAHNVLFGKLQEIFPIQK